MVDTTAVDDGKLNVQERILHAAEELFASSSYSATRISDIAAKAGVNQALVHYYFSTKERLYEAVLERLFQQWESYLQKQSWEDVHPEQMLRQYIEMHFEIKCKIPNLYKIFHKESIDGGQLFNQFASAQWVQDYKEKSEMFKRWKQAGIIDPHANEQVVLFCLWGMMNQFYYRELDALQMITGHAGTKEQLQQEIVEQMVALAQHGILTQLQPRQEQQGAEQKLVQLLVAPSELEELEDELALIEETVAGWNGCRLQLISSPQELLAGNEQQLTLIVTSTHVGELSQQLVAWLHALEQTSALVADRYVGIWTKKGNAAAEHVQQQLEDTINRLGGFAVARPAALTLHGYLHRCAKMSKL